jgi:transcriptional regulator with XRE-family HTH domain
VLDKTISSRTAKQIKPEDKHIGARVRMRRMQLKMSQGDLGAALGLTFQQIQKYEKGANRIGGSRMHQLSQKLQVPVQFFYEGLAPSGSKYQPNIVNEVLSTSEGLAIVEAFYKIKDSAIRRKFVALAQAVADGQDD